jgi:hypothetical protein
MSFQFPHNKFVTIAASLICARSSSAFLLELNHEGNEKESLQKFSRMEVFGLHQELRQQPKLRMPQLWLHEQQWRPFQ